MLVSGDLENLAARLHGRRSRLADGGRLAALCALGSPAALAAAVLGQSVPGAAAEAQQRMVLNFISEALEIASCLGGAQGEYVRWLAARPQGENLKAALRSLSSGAGPELLQAALQRLPAGLAGCGQELAAARAEGDLAGLLPPGFWRDALSSAQAAAGGIFLREAALDREYLSGLAARAAALSGEGAGLASVLAGHEAAAFNLLLAARGLFMHGLKKEELVPFYAPGPAMDRAGFGRLLAASGPAELQILAAGSAVDGAPAAAGPAGLEALVWRRHFRLAVRALRRGHMGIGAVAGYLALRRIETANLVSVAEGLRLGVEAGELARRLIPRAGAYV